MSRARGFREVSLARACKHNGFTLVEVIFVVVILGVVASIGSSFVVSTMDSYRVAETRNKLVQGGRLTLEQMARELRMSAPSSTRVSSSGRCVEFMPLVAYTRYQGMLPTADNSAAETATLQTGEFAINASTPRHVLVAPYTPAEVYSSAKPGARVGYGGSATGSYTSIQLSGNHRFLRDSVAGRVFLAADPVRFCALNGLLQRISAYGFDTSALTDVPPSTGVIDLMAQNADADGRAFTLAPGSEERNVAVLIRLVFASGSTSLNLSHQVLIRNVP